QLLLFLQRRELGAKLLLQFLGDTPGELPVALRYLHRRLGWRPGARGLLDRSLGQRAQRPRPPHRVGPTATSGCQPGATALQRLHHLPQRIVLALEHRVPQLARMPRNRALAAAGEADAAGAEIGAAAGIVQQMVERHVPAAVDVAARVEIDQKEHRTDDLQALIDTQKTRTDLATDKFRQADDLVEDGFELHLQHFLDQLIAVKKNHRLVYDTLLVHPLFLMCCYRLGPGMLSNRLLILARTELRLRVLNLSDWC